MRGRSEAIRGSSEAIRVFEKPGTATNEARRRQAQHRDGAGQRGTAEARTAQRAKVPRGIAGQTG
jgi:hypothetical protein